ncbi:MAG TPA: MBL fold metallo-hydrolase [Candidatus Bathyarchaeia archaeon]|jgi:L-ascorbate metabolism protein UlaG (beta-lactamase superfamily)|nr:MBL fold metallo-hydrolase [Candidatus Bathyarchaeia archaeon]
MTVSIKLLAHAGFQIKTKNKIVYVDLEKYGKFSEKADLILVTHSHTDHCDPAQIERARKTDTLIIAPSDCVSKIGGNVKTLNVGEEITVGDVKVKAVEAYNFKRFRSPGNPFHPKGFGVGYLITAEGKTVYHAGDTDFIPEMKKLGRVDVALLPSGGTYTMDNAEAVDAALAINPSVVIPMHRWDTNAEEFKKKVEADSKIKVVLLNANEEFQVV